MSSSKLVIPRHIAIIMDGNGRWAKERGLPRYAGHRQGVERVKEIVRAARELGVKVLTLYAFSAENWRRPKREVAVLMTYLDRFLHSQVHDMLKNDIRLRVIGRDDPIPPRLLKRLAASQERTAHCRSMTLVLALNYGGRQELVDAARACAEEVAARKTSPSEIDERYFAAHLYTAGLPDPDLMIRTSGEMRLSNFLLWQLSYAEFCFPEKFWPDFRKEDLARAIADYGMRARRFGGVDADTTSDQ